VALGDIGSFRQGGQKMQPTALLSVYDKTGIVPFSKGLTTLGWKLISSGGTAKVLREAGIEVIDVAEFSGLEAILDHRVVTLVPQVHGGLLALDNTKHDADRAKINASWIDMACIDLYPLAAEISRPGATLESVIAKTDVGGPTMIASAAKGGRITICDPADRPIVLDWLERVKPDLKQLRREPFKDLFVYGLIAKAYATLRDYNALSADYHKQYLASHQAT